MALAVGLASASERSVRSRSSEKEIDNDKVWGKGEDEVKHTDKEVSFVIADSGVALVPAPSVSLGMEEDKHVQESETDAEREREMERIRVQQMQDLLKKLEEVGNVGLKFKEITLTLLHATLQTE